MNYPDRFTTEKVKELGSFKYSHIHEIRNKFIGLSLDFLPLYILLGLIILNFLNVDEGILFLLSIIGIVYSLIHFYILFINSNHLVLKKYEIKISGLKKEESFIFVSDMHFGKEYYGASRNKIRNMVNIINSRNKDLVIFGGDFVCSSLDSSIAEEYAKVKAENVLGIYGNHDSLYLKDTQVGAMPEKFLASMKDSGIKFLNNEGFKYKDIYFGGITDLYSLNLDVPKAFEKDNESGVRVLLSHHPDIFDFVKDEDSISLVLSGHTHGGQIYLPIIGSVLPIPCRNKNLVKGLYKMSDKTQLFISEGAGFSSTRIRVGTQCEICEITLTPL